MNDGLVKNHSRNAGDFTALEGGLIFIPEWFEGVAKTFNHKIGDLIDPYLMYETMIRDNIGLFLHLNREATKLFPVLTNSFHDYDFYHMLRHNAEKHSNIINDSMSVDKFQKLIQGYMQDSSWSNPLDSVCCVIEASLSRQNKRPLEEIRLNDYVFELISLREKVYGMRLVRADPTRSYEEQRAEAISRSIELLLGYYQFQDIARTPLFCELVRISENAA